MKAKLQLRFSLTGDLAKMHKILQQPLLSQQLMPILSQLAQLVLENSRMNKSRCSIMKAITGLLKDRLELIQINQPGLHQSYIQLISQLPLQPPFLISHLLHLSRQSHLSLYRIPLMLPSRTLSNGHLKFPKNSL